MTGYRLNRLAILDNSAKRYQHPTWVKKTTNPLSEPITNKSTTKIRPTELVYWENLRAELVKFIKKDPQGKDHFPTIEWFGKKRIFITDAFRYAGGYSETVKLMVADGLLAADYIPITNTRERISKYDSEEIFLSEWKNLSIAMLKMCQEIGKFPKSIREMNDLGYEQTAFVITKYYGSLREVEKLMREDGLLKGFSNSD